jgi:acyl-CoA dehydrogenase
MANNPLLDRASEAAAVAAQYCEEVDRDSRFPHEAIRAMRDSRLLGVMMPRDLGGESASLADIAEVCCLLGQHCSSTAMVYAMHQIKASSLASHGRESNWHRDFMARVASEQLLLGSSTTEAGTGGDLGSSVCAIERDGDHFNLRKDATVISYALQSDAIMVTTRRAPDAPPSDQVMAVVTKDQYTLQQTAGWNTLGMRGTCSEGYILEARAPAEQIFPQPFADIAARSMLAHAHILWGSLWYGIAANAMSRAQSYIRVEARKKPGSTPSGAARVGNAAALLQLIKSSLETAIARYETARHSPDVLTSVAFALDMNNLKIGVSRLTVDVVQEALMVCGIHGYKNDTPYSLGRHLRDALSAPLMINNDRIASNTSNLLLVHRLDQRLAG